MITVILAVIYIIIENLIFLGCLFFPHLSPAAWSEIEGKDFIYAARYVSVCIFPKMLY